MVFPVEKSGPADFSKLTYTRQRDKWFISWKINILNIDFIHSCNHRRSKLTFRESEGLIIFLFIKASRLCELERDLSSNAVLCYTRTVENLRAL